jgi:hypothetical protein
MEAFKAKQPCRVFPRMTSSNTCSPVAISQHTSIWRSIAEALPQMWRVGRTLSVRCYCLIGVDRLHVGAGQNNANTLTWRWTTSGLQYSCSPAGNEFAQFLTVSIEYVYHPYWQTSSNCFRDVGGENLFLDVISKIDQVQVRWLCWPGKMLKFSFTLFKSWMNSFSCVNGGTAVLVDKLHLCGSWDAPDYPTCPRTPLQ